MARGQGPGVRGQELARPWPLLSPFPTARPARLVLLLQDLKFGGTQRQTLELARRLDPAQFRVEVWVMTAGDDLAPLAREWSIPVVRLARQAVVGPLALMNLWRRLHRQPPDLLMLLTVSSLVLVEACVRLGHDALPRMSLLADFRNRPCPNRCYPNAAAERNS